jgi:hypothetical protein
MFQLWLEIVATESIWTNITNSNKLCGFSGCCTTQSRTLDQKRVDFNVPITIFQPNEECWNYHTIVLFQSVVCYLWLICSHNELTIRRWTHNWEADSHTMVAVISELFFSIYPSHNYIFGGKNGATIKIC